MGAQYYYLVSSLPGLSFSSPAPVTAENFLDDCRRQLAAPDMFELESILAGFREGTHSAFGTAWLDADCQLRNAAVRQRALRLGVDEKKYTQGHPGFRVDAEEAVSDAFSRSNPLERELTLDRFRWSLADELSAGDPFGLPALLAYAVKLEINARWQSLTPETGRQRLEEMLAVVATTAEEAAGWTGLAGM